MSCIDQLLNYAYMDKEHSFVTIMGGKKMSNCLRARGRDSYIAF